MANFTEGNTPFGRFTRTQTSITFKDTIAFPGEEPEACDVIIHVKYEKSDPGYVFNITYTNLIKKKPIENYKENYAFLHCHPLAELVVSQDYPCLLEGSIVPANPITFHLIESLMREEIDECGQYYTGVVTEKCYKGQLMRALTHLEL